MNPVPSNPYNPRDPIRDPEYFIGREEELDEIQYHLSLALSDRSQYANIGITGEEGSGKSSLGYMAMVHAEEMDIEPVRVALDEGDVTREITIFRKILDGLTEAIGGSVRESFIDGISGIVDSVDVNFQVLKLHLSPDNDNEELLNQSVKSDLRRLYDEVDSPAFAIVIDNAQYLAKNRELLQKLKNIFTETDGYILILVGTEETFEEISTVFSPTARMFEKFQIGPFESIDETKECILRPLADDDRDIIDEKTIGEIHRITGGKPFEINLICFQLYKYYEQSDLDEMRLSEDVIENVVAQMEVWNENIKGNLDESIKGLTNSELRLVVSAIECGPATENMLINYSILHVLNTTRVDNISKRKKELKAELEHLIENQILEKIDGEVGLSTDLYSIAFVKYYAISRGLIENLSSPSVKGLDTEGFPISNIHYRLIDRNVLKSIDESHSHYIPDPRGDQYEPTLRSVEVANFSETGIQPGFPDLGISVFETDEWQFGGSNYLESVERPDEYAEMSTYPELTFRCNIGWIDRGYLGIIHFENVEEDKEIEMVKSQVREKLDNLVDKLDEIGIELIQHDEKTLRGEAVDLYRDENYTEALDRLNYAIETNPNDPKSWHYRAVVNREMERYDEALDDINQCIELWDQWGDPHITKAAIHIGRSEFDDAFSSFKRADDIFEINDGAELWAKASHDFDEHGEPEKAIRAAELALEYDESNDHARIHLASCQSRIGQKEEGLETLEQLSENWRNSTDLLLLGADLIANQGDGLIEDNLHEAVELLSEYLEESDGDDSKIALAYFNRSCYYSRLSMSEPAISDLKYAIEIDRDIIDLCENDDDLDYLRGEGELESLLNEFRE